MEDKKIIEKLEEQEKKIDAIYKSVEKTRKMFLFTTIATVVMFVLPLLALIFIVPLVLGMVGGMYEGLL